MVGVIEWDVLLVGGIVFAGSRVSQIRRWLWSRWDGYEELSADCESAAGLRDPGQRLSFAITTGSQRKLGA